jgi:hypothetical protein
LETVGKKIHYINETSPEPGLNNAANMSTSADQQQNLCASMFDKLEERLGPLDPDDFQGLGGQWDINILFASLSSCKKKKKDYSTSDPSNTSSPASPEEHSDTSSPVAGPALPSATPNPSPKQSPKPKQPVKLCPHGRVSKRDCRDCGGVGICEHDRRRRACPECRQTNGSESLESLPCTVVPTVVPTVGPMMGPTNASTKSKKRKAPAELSPNLAGASYLNVISRLAVTIEFLTKAASADSEATNQLLGEIEAIAKGITLQYQ